MPVPSQLNYETFGEQRDIVVFCPHLTKSKLILKLILTVTKLRTSVEHENHTIHIQLIMK